MSYLADLHPLQKRRVMEKQSSVLCASFFEARKLFHGSTKFLPLIKVCKCIRSLYFEFKAWNLAIHCIMYHQIFIKFYYYISKYEL